MRAGYSQRQLGVLVGLDQAVASARMNQYERGVHEPHFAFVKRLAATLRAPAAYFYAEEPGLADLILAFGELSAADRKKAHLRVPRGG